MIGESPIDSLGLPRPDRQSQPEQPLPAPLAPLPQGFLSATSNVEEKKEKKKQTVSSAPGGVGQAPPDPTDVSGMSSEAAGTSTPNLQTRSGLLSDSSGLMTADGKITVWVKGENYLDAEALKVTVSGNASIGDLLLVSFDLFSIGQYGGVRPADVEVQWRGQSLSNRQLLREFLREELKYRKKYDEEGRLVSVKEVSITDELFVVRHKFSRYPTFENKYNRRESPGAAIRRRARTPTKPTKFRQTATFGSPNTHHGEEAKPAADRLSKKEVEEKLAQAYYARETVRQQLRAVSAGRRRGGAPAAAGTTTPLRQSTRSGEPSLATPTPRGGMNNYSSLSASTVAPPSAGHRTSSPLAGEMVNPATCDFMPLWGTLLCGNCGCRREVHKKKPPTTEDIQKQLLRLSPFKSDTPVRSGRSKKERAALWKSPSPKGAHAGPKAVCKHFVAIWGRPNACEHCGHPASYHETLPEDRKVVALSHAKRPPPPTNPRGTKSRGVCREFVPLWNCNDHCTNCYHRMDEHKVDDLPSYQKNQFTKRQMTAAEIAARKKRRDTLKMCALPWHEILPWCQVTDLFRAAQICRLITMVSRPILEATMIQVLEFEITEERDDLWRKAVHVAENLAPYSDVARHMLATCLMIVHSATEGEGEDDVGAAAAAAVIAAGGGDQEAAAAAAAANEGDATEEKINKFTYRIELVKQIACIHPMSLDPSAGREIKDLEAFNVGHGDDLYPLLVYLRALWLQHKVKTKAQRYLQHTKLFL